MAGKVQKHSRALGFRLVQLRKINHRNARKLLSHQPVGLQKPGNALLHRLIAFHLQKPGGGRNQLFLRQEAVAAGEIIAQLKQSARFHPPGIVPGNAQADGKLIHRPEGGVQLLVHQKVRVIIQELHGAVAVPLVHLHCQLRAQMMQGEKLHDLPDAHMELEFLPDFPGLFPGNAGDFRKPLRLPLHDGQGLIAEHLHNPGGRSGADALDDPAGQVVEDFHGGLGHKPLQKFRLELTSIIGMGAPLARDHQPLAHRGQGDGAHHRHRLPAA